MSLFVSKSVARVILHTCVGAPTYLDTLPGDVLRFCIMPFLSWEDRIHVNMLTPPGDRTPPKKIPVERIVANQLLVCAQKLMPRLKIATNLQEIRARYRIRGKRGGPSVIRIVEGIIAFLQSLLEGHNLLLIQYSMKFRTTTELKIIQFSDPVFIATIPRIYQRNQMIAVIKQLTEKLAALPFIKHVKSQRFLSATVTQNKTSQPRGRYQGIYTEAE